MSIPPSCPFGMTSFMPLLVYDLLFILAFPNAFGQGALLFPLGLFSDLSGFGLFAPALFLVAQSNLR